MSKTVATPMRFTLALVLLIGLSQAALAAPRAWRKGDPTYALKELLPHGWPTFSEVIVTASASVRGNGFFYQYNITNSQKNAMPIEQLAIDLRIDAEKKPPPSTDIHLVMFTSGPSVHPGLVFAPPGWDTYSSSSPVIWTHTEDQNCLGCIAPGHSLSGFALTANEPPGIRYFTIEGFDIYAAGTSITDDALASELQSMGFSSDISGLNEALSLGFEAAGMTIAPVKPSAPFSLESWCAHMSTLAKQARSLGWLSSDRQLADLEQLIAGLNQTDRAKRLAAVNALTRYVSGEQRANRLRNEAATLMSLNADYLLRVTGEQLH